MKVVQANNQLFFSVIICSFNGEKYIQRCIESILQQNFPKEKFEIIVVNDGSTDKTEKIVKKLPVKLITHKKNKGIAASRNTGLKFARGQVYVCFDDDCYVDKNWLSNLSKAYKKFHVINIAGVGGLILLPKKVGLTEKYLDASGYGNPSPLYVTKAKNIFSRFGSYLKTMFSPSIRTREKIFEVGEIWGANCSFPVDVLKAVNGWDEKLSGVEDTDICNRIKKTFPSKKFICNKEAILYHDRDIALKDFILRPYKRGNVILKFYLQNNKIPPLFPFPLLISLISAATALINPIWGGISLIVLPLPFYSWWIVRALKQKNISFLLFSYIQFLYEFFSLAGILKGYVKNKLFSHRTLILIPLLAIGVLTNIFIHYNTNFLFLRTIFSSLYLLFIPGLLISWVSKIVYKSFWELFAYTIGMSIVTLMLFGLGINYLLPHISALIFHLHIFKPLTLLPILYSFNFFVGIIWISILFTKNSFPLEKSNHLVSSKEIPFIITPIFFPILAVMGAISLNNNESNIFTLIMLGLTAGFVFILAVFREKLHNFIFPWTLFFISISLLFMTSLRGWYITGHDINLEYYVFQLTKTQGVWKITNFQDPYNACLSITILPTIVSLLTNIKDAYIYKIIYQVLFASSIVTTFVFIRKFLSPFLAFLATFAIVSLPTFMTDMPMLNRQEIALLFFVLLLNTLFTKHLSPVKKFTIFVVFSLGMLLSHYSTTYLSLVLFIGAYLAHIPLRLINLHPTTKTFAEKIYSKLGIIDAKPNLHLAMVILLTATTILWNVNITNTSAGIIKTFNKIITSFHTTKKSVNINPYLANGKIPSNPQILLDTYINITTQYMHTVNTESAFIKKEAYNQYKVIVGKERIDALTGLGKALSKIHISAYSINDLLKQLYAKIIQLFIVVGFFAIFFLRKHISNFEKEYLILTLVFFAILVIQVVLPGGSIDYGILRLFQQGMVLFSVPLIMGGLWVLSVFDKLHKSIKIYLLTGTFVVFFLYLSGFIPQITGGYYPQLNVSNGGFYYDAYYTHTTDIASMTWLAKYRDTKTPVQSDWFALNKIHAYEGFYSFDALIPSSIRVNSYVYLSTFNVTTGEVIEYINGNPIYYTYDFSLLNNNKNLIYSNGKSKIYR